MSCFVSICLRSVTATIVSSLRAVAPQYLKRTSAGATQLSQDDEDPDHLADEGKWERGVGGEVGEAMRCTVSFLDEGVFENLSYVGVSPAHQERLDRVDVQPDVQPVYNFSHRSPASDNIVGFVVPTHSLSSGYIHTTFTASPIGIG